MVVNIVLSLVGVLLAPATLRAPSGVGIVVADVGLQVGLVLVALFGPVSLSRVDPLAGFCLVVGVVFALAYDGLLALDLAGHPLPLTPYVFFVAGAIVASSWVSYRTRRVASGVFAGIWSLLLGTILWSAGGW